MQYSNTFQTTPSQCRKEFSTSSVWLELAPALEINNTVFEGGPADLEML